ncbi:MAG: magnesium chelatase domain-containing protein [Candidatus Limnocylindrales bacterium]
MLAVVPSATLHGLDGRPIRVEVDVAPGLPGFTIVGLADTALQESRERVRGAIRNAGFVYPPRRITINLAPADLRKAGASLDLAMALGILLGSEQVRAGRGTVALIGELSLGGEVRAVPGILPMVAALARRGVRHVVVADAGLEEARLVGGLEVHGVASLAEAAAVVRGRNARRPPVAMPRVSIVATDEGPGPARITGSAGPGSSDPGTAGGPQHGPGVRIPDLADVRGQVEARRALEIALAGGHGLLMIGPPGVGKTLLASTIPGLLPALDDAAALAVTIVASAAGRVPCPPFGEHRRSALRTTRCPPRRWSVGTPAHARRDHPGRSGRAVPGRTGGIRSGRSRGAPTAAGVRSRGHRPGRPGHVVPGAIPVGRRDEPVPVRLQRFRAGRPVHLQREGRRALCAARVRPLRDRIDLWVAMPRVAPGALVSGMEPESSAAVGARIGAARAMACARGGELNGRLRGRDLRAACRLDGAARRRLVSLAETEGASGRGTERILRVAWTIADLAGRVEVWGEDLDEAGWFRSPMERAAGALAS